MKTKLLRLFVFIALACYTVDESRAQNCNVYGSIIPPVTPVMPKTNTIGGYSLPTTVGTSSQKAIGDFNGDGLDDIFMFGIEVNSSNQPYVKVLTSDGNGGFNLVWSTTLGNNSLSFMNNNNNNISSTSLDLLSGHSTDWKFYTGNFVGDNKDELLIIQPANQGGDSFWFLLGDIMNPNPRLLSFVSYPVNTFGVGTLLGGAHLSGDFYATNLLSDSHDELFSIQSINGQVKWLVQGFTGVNNTPIQFPNITTGWLGNWNVAAVGLIPNLHFANFNLNDNYDEMFVIQMNGTWAMMQDFVIGNSNTSNFISYWHNGGSGSLYQLNQCPSGQTLVTWSTNTRFYFGNWDNCDADIEGMLINNNDIGQCASFEFNSLSQSFRCGSVKWPDLLNRNAMLDDFSIFKCDASERWTDERYCCGWMFGIEGGVCIEYCGGASHIQQRHFYDIDKREGDLTIYMGNFYNNTSNDGFNFDTKDLLVFRNSVFSSVPSQLCGQVFVTSVTSGAMDGPNKPGDGNVSIFNLAGQLIAFYNVNTGLFSNSGAVSRFGTVTMYSNKSNVENFKLNESQNVGDNQSEELNQPRTIDQSSIINGEGKKNSKTKSTTISEIVFNEIYLDATPNPASNIIKLKLRSNIDLINTKIEILSMDGSLIDRFYHDFKAGESVNEISVADYVNGLYIVKYTTSNNEMYIAKFIKN